MSHGAAAEMTFADAIPHRYKSSMVALPCVNIVVLVGFSDRSSTKHITLDPCPFACALHAAFRKEMVDDLEAADDNTNTSWFIDSCFTHCQTFFDGSAWNLPVAPRIGNRVRWN